MRHQLSINSSGHMNQPFSHEDIKIIKDFVELFDHAVVIAHKGEIDRQNPYAN